MVSVAATRWVWNRADTLVYARLLGLGSSTLPSEVLARLMFSECQTTVSTRTNSKTQNSVAAGQRGVQIAGDSGLGRLFVHVGEERRSLTHSRAGTEQHWK